MPPHVKPDELHVHVHLPPALFVALGKLADAMLERSMLPALTARINGITAENDALKARLQATLPSNAP